VRDGWDDPRAARTLALAGLLGGCAALTKNEGFVFLGASSVVVAWIAVKHGRFAVRYGGQRRAAAGGLMIWFKLSFPWGRRSTSRSRRQPRLAQRILDVDRLRLIAP
jgi:hypothetical protein